MPMREEMESDQSHPRGKRGRIPPWLGKAEDRGHSLPSRATFQNIPGKMINIKEGQEKGEI